MVSYSLTQLASILNAELIGNKEAEVNQVWFDSRLIVQDSKGIFFAIPGKDRSGYDYIAEVLNKGIENFVVSQVPYNIEANFLVVKDVTIALQTWAAFHRKQYSGKVIGITGTHGKTIIKEWLYQLLHKKIRVHRSPKSYNSQIGVPLSVLEIDNKSTLALIEMGISQPNEMERLVNIVKPDIAVLSMIGNAHSEYFKNLEEQIAEKSKIFEKAQIVIIPNDNSAIKEYVTSENLGTDLITFGKEVGSTIQLITDWKDPNIMVQYKGKLFNLEIPFTDEASIYNAVVSFAIITQLGLNLDTITEGFSNLEPIEMRLSRKKGVNNNVIIDDTYNSDLSSLPIALNMLKNHYYFKKTLIITDILEDRRMPKSLYKEVAELVNAYPIQKVILIGNGIALYKRFFNKLYKSYNSTTEFLDNYTPNNFYNEVILLKGARRFGLEKISKELEEQSHETVLEVDLSNLIENVKFFKSLLKPEAKIMAMVKASAYGVGGVEVAQVLKDRSIDYFGVAYADEGVELRNHGISQCIMVMNPEQNSYDTIIKHYLEPEVYSLKMLENFLNALSYNLAEPDYPVHIKLNTGMNRLGFNQEDIPSLIEKLANNKQIKVESIFSHLATSDMPSETEFVHQQAAELNEMYQKLTFAIGYKPIKHISNSAAIINYPDYQMDMVRMGIGMYGISANPEYQKFLKHVITFKTVISQINKIKQGQSVGYGRNYYAKSDKTIATLPVGYADGVKRILSNGRGKVSIHNQLVDIIGNVCMDMLMVDISGVDCKEGDEVIIFGDNPTLNEIAKWSDTISYEILTSISSRVKRIYIQDN